MIRFFFSGIGLKRQKIMMVCVRQNDDEKLDGGVYDDPTIR